VALSAGTPTGLGRGTDGRGGRAAVGRVVRAVSRALPWLVGAWYGLVTLDLAGSPAAAWGGLALAGVLGAALVWRRDRPELSAAVVLGASLASHLLVPEMVVPIAGMVAVWSLALTRPPRVSLVGLAGLLAVSATNLLTTTLDDTVFTMVLAVSVWALAEAARNRRTAIGEAARRAVSDEQARIARELHDVIAHSVSVIVVQAAAAGDVFDARPDQARAALRSIEGTGREALRELRRLLGGVRADDPGAPQPEGANVPIPPQPGLDRVEELAAPLRAAGLQVVVTCEGSVADLPAGVDISAYRIVQEALTNTLRHARATVAEVTLRVVIADDQALVRVGFRMILDARDDIEVVGEAADGAEAARLVADLVPDVVLMDVRMPGVDGIEATRRIVASGCPTRIIILTTYDVDEYVFAALRGGASGFMLKDVQPTELVDGVRVVARGDALLAASVTRRLLDRFVDALPGADAPPPPDLGELTAREVEVLRLVAAALSNGEIAGRLVLSEATVKTHVSSVLRKLGLRDRVQAVVLAYDVGLVQPRPP